MCQPCPGPSHPLVFPAKDYRGRSALGQGTNGLFGACSPPEGEPRLVSTQDWPPLEAFLLSPHCRHLQHRSLSCVVGSQLLSPVGRVHSAVCLLYRDVVQGPVVVLA